MNWINDTQNAINFIEHNLLEDINVEEVSNHIHSSTGYFQRIFNIVTGISISEYIRNRRLSLAGEELKNTQEKVIDVSLKYGYDSPDSFTKAFMRFHGITPMFAKVSNNLKYFYPLSIKIYIKGGFGMNRKLIPNIPLLTYNGNNVAYFSNILDAALQGMGEASDKARITVYSGEGNRFCWTDGDWVFGNETMGILNESLFELENRILLNLGWNAKYFSVQRNKNGTILNTDATQLRKDFVDAIDRGVPVIPFWDHFQIGYTIFFGYEDDGKKMVGWNYQNNVNEPFVWDDWENKIDRYIILQEKIEPKPEKEAALELFNIISHHARRSDSLNGRKAGFAAWESFLYHLEHDDFSECAVLAKDAPTIKGVAYSSEHRFFIYCDTLCQIDARNGAVPYYQSLSGRFPEWQEELRIASSALATCASYGGFLWNHGFSFNEKGFEKFKTPEARKILANAGREAMAKDMEAVEQFEKILQREGIRKGDLKCH